MLSDEVLLALISAFTAIAGRELLAKIIDKLFVSSDRKLDDGVKIRAELWERQDELEKRLEERQKECDKRLSIIQATLDEWKTRYYELLEQHHTLKAENHGIREENHQLLSKLSAVQLSMQHLQRQVDRISPESPTTGPTADMPGLGHTILEEQ